MTEGVLLVGGGGHCASVIEAMLSSGEWRVRGIVDGNLEGDVMGFPVLGGDSMISSLVSTGDEALVTVGQMETPRTRMLLRDLLVGAGAVFPVIRASSAVIAVGAAIGEGTVLLHHSLVNARARIGAHCIVNSMALVEHDTAIGDFSHISTGARVNGGCSIGEGVFVGSGAVIAQGRSVCPGAVIGAGCVVIRDILEKGVYAGNPARRLR